jgi:hypothetical protein
LYIRSCLFDGYGPYTYNDPTPKMQIKPAFWALGICNLTTMGIGSTRSKMSVTIFNTAVAM